MNEVWLDINYVDSITNEVVDYTNYYQISNTGKIRSYPRYGTTNNLHYLTIKEYNNCRYNRVVLSKNNKTKSFNVHRLVASMFLPNPNHLPIVNHKDENRSNNLVWINDDGSVDYEKSNLEWCTQRYNNNYGTGRFRASKNCKKAVIAFDGVHKLGTYFVSTTDAAKYLGVGKSTICSALKGYKYRNTSCGYRWEYV